VPALCNEVLLHAVRMNEAVGLWSELRSKDLRLVDRVSNVQATDSDCGAENWRSGDAWSSRLMSSGCQFDLQ
jgi:hypothetical protein